MKTLHYCRLMLIVIYSLCRISSAQAERIPQISTKIGGRPAVVPQSYFDAVAVEAVDPNMHPSLGPFTVTAVKSGNWSDPTLWSTGTVPGADATVNLGAHIVTYDVSSTVKIKHIHNSHDGIFERAPGSVLWVSTQMFHGKYIEGEADSPIPNSNPTRTIYWYSDAPGQTVKYGLVCMGPARLRGETKQHFLNAANNLTTGATTIQLIGVAGSNWKVGDEICITATEASSTSTTDPTYTGPTSFTGSWNGSEGTQTQSQGFKTSQDEPRTITAISGDTLTLSAPLAFNHNVYSTTLPRGEAVTVRPYVVNFTRSIQHRAEVASNVLQQRPHMMFMHDDDVDIRYVDILNFGRTSTDPSLDVPTSAGGKEVYLDTVNLADTNNVRGRYGLHIHGTGAFFGRKMVVIQGIVVRGENGPSLTAIPVPGWGIVQHNSRCAIEDSITYNVRGAGFVSELGNEIGQWVNNISIWNRGDGFKTSWSSRQETHTNHNGHMGVAYENQSRGILQQKNVAISSHFGWMFHQQNTNQVARVPDKFSLRYKDPFTQGGKQGFASWEPNAQDNHTYGIEQDQIHDFFDNTCLNVGTGFFVAHRQVTDRGDQSVMFAKRFHCIGTSTPFNIANYTFYYSVYDSWWRGTGSGTAAPMGGNTHGMMFVNLRLENHATGFKDSGLGFNYNGFWIDVGFTNVATPFDNTKTCTSGIESHPFQDLMGPWTVTDENNPDPGFTARVRTWSSIPSSSLPSPYPLAPVGMGGVKPPGAATPSFTLDPNSDTTTGPTGYNTLSLSGIIVDHVGVRKWPDGYVTFNDLYVPQAIGPRKNIDATTGTEMVETNGCFNDSGTWKCRLWFHLDERRDGNYLQFPIDITLTGFDPGFLAANTVDPNATKPILPLALESISDLGPGPFSPMIALTPASVSLEPGSVRQFAATAYDETGNATSPQPVFTWAVSGGGTIDTNGLFTAGSSVGGPYTVTVSSGSLSATAQVTVANIPNDADDGTWTQLSAGSATGNWDDATTANWSGGTVAVGSGSTADFSTLNITAASIVTLTAPRTIGNLTFGDTSNTSVASWTLAGTGANILTLAGTTPTVTVNDLGTGSLTNSTVTISAKISGTNGLIKSGTGTVASTSTFGKGVLVLSGANDYTGGATISSGALAAASSSALGTGDVTVSSGAQLQVRGVSIANTININGTGALFSTAGSGSNLTGTVNLQSNSSIGLASNSGNATLTLSGTLKLNGFTLTATMINVTPATTLSASINGSGGISAGTSGALRITGNNSSTYSGTTTINGNSTVLELGNDGALGSGTLALGGNGFTNTLRSVDANARTLSNTLVLNGNASTTYALGSATTGNLTFTGTTAIALGSVRTFNVLNSQTQFDAAFTGASGGITKSGAGTLVLTSTASSYTGATTVNAGKLMVNGSLGTTAVSVNSNGTLSGTGSIGGSVTVNTGGHLACAVASAPGSQVPLTITGALNLGSGNILDLTATPTPANGVYTLATAGGGVTYTAGTVNLSGVSGVVSVSGNSLILTVGGGGSANFAGWSSANGVTSGVNGDSDNDGIPNGVEYGLNTNLAGSDGAPGTYTGNVLTFNKRAATSGMSYRIEVSTDLGVSVPWAEVGAYIQNDASIISAAIPNGPAKTFARLRVVVNP